MITVIYLGFREIYCGAIKLVALPADWCSLQVPPLIQELRNLSPAIKSGQLAPVLKQLDDAMLERRTGKFTEKSSKV